MRPDARGSEVAFAAGGVAFYLVATGQVRVFATQGGGHTPRCDPKLLDGVLQIMSEAPPF